MSERARRVDSLFQEALDAPDREVFLAGCGELRDDVAGLLHAHEHMGGFLATPAWERMQGVGLGEGDRVGRYTIRRRIAEGGGGTVYEAEQEQPRRTVALKILKRGSPRWLEEAEILARLKHPDIATVHEAGMHEGTPFIAMEYVEGPTLVDAAAALPRREMLALFARVCDVVHYGHLRGVIHRDLKPANVLVRDTGPKVIDFGIAAVTGGSPGEIAGTLPYMSPEQCDGAEIDARSDVYSLGAILCRIASGRLPCDVSGLTLSEALRTLREAPVPDPGGDLGAIVRKALARDREARYASAAALADDVRRYLRHEPVLSRPSSLVHAAALLFRRRTGTAVSLVALAVVLVAGVAVSLRFAVRADRRRTEAVAARDDAELRLYVANLAVAQAALRDHDVTEARRRLESAPERLRDWEWRHLISQIDLSERRIEWPGRTVWAGAASADGRLVATSAHGGHAEVAVFDVATGERVSAWDVGEGVVECLAFDPEGRMVASGGRDGSVELRDVATGALVRRFEAGSSIVNDVAFDGAGALVAGASRDGTIRVFEVKSGAPRGELRGHSDRVVCVRFGPDGRVFSGGRDGEIRVWSGERAVAVLSGHEGSVEGISVSPDGTRLASVSRDLTLRLWDLATLRQVAVGKGHGENVRAVAFGPSGDLVATASYDRTVRVWSGRTASPVATLRGHATVVRNVAFPGGVVSFGGDGARFWPVGGAPEGVPIRGAFDGVRSVAFSGASIVGGACDGSVRWWDPATGAETRCADAGGLVLWVAARGDRVGTCTESGRFRSWPDGLAIDVPGAGRAWDGARGTVYGSTGGSLVAVGNGPQRAIEAHEGAIRAVAVDVPGGRIATAGDDGRIRLWESEGLRGPRAEARFQDPGCALSFSPDGARLAVGHRDGSVSVLDGRTFAVAFHREGHSADVTSVAFHPSGRRLATSAADECIRLWDVATGTEVAVLRAAMRVNSVAFDTSGTRLAAGLGSEGVPGAIRLWSAPDKP